MKEIIFLFGAGASFGAGSILPEPPPLGYQLYPILENLYPNTWGGIPQYIKREFNDSKNFEIGMKQIYNEFGHLIPLLMREMAIYFVQFRPINKSSLYCKLIADIHKNGLMNRCLFSTLNYECVVEYSLLGQGFEISYSEDHDLEKIPVWKLHGSCNFFSTFQVSPDVNYGTGATINSGIKASFDPSRVIQHCLSETGLAPVMCLYMENKVLNVSPGAIKQLQKAWADRIGNASTVFIIGANPNIQDKHIWEPLSNTKADLFFIGDHQALNKWKEKFRTNGTEYLGARFNIAYPKLIRRITGHVDK